MENSDEVLIQTRNELIQDFQEIEYLLSDLSTKIVEYLHSSPFSTQLSGIALQIQDLLGNINTQVLANLTDAPYEEILTYIEKKRQSSFFVREAYSVVSGIVISPDWQSPSYSHILTSHAGRQEGKIIEHIFDYKRDRHIDAYEYEKRFAAEYHAAKTTNSIRALATNSGMAAFSTVLMTLMQEKKLNDPILIAHELYHENTQLIKSLCTGPIIELPKADPQEIIDAIKTHSPSALFVDTLSNTKHISIPDIGTILDLIDDLSTPIVVVLDNTGLSASYTPFSKFHDTKHTIVVTESLLKYYQFGLDRATGGVITTHGSFAERCENMREHLGTNIGDYQTLCLPKPSKVFLLKRLAHLEKNAKMLANHVNNIAGQTKNSIITCAHYPFAHQGFAGSFFTFEFAPQAKKIEVYQQFIEYLNQAAKKYQIELIGGTSFGFYTSRVYLTAYHTRFGDPFIRFSAGNETTLEMEKMKHVLSEAIMKMDDRFK